MVIKIRQEKRLFPVQNVITEHSLYSQDIDNGICILHI